MGLLVLSGCKDEGEARYREALAQDEELIRAGRPPTDPAFDRVLEKLREVPASSPARGKADELQASITRGRSPRIERPLATPDQSECARLAEALGKAAPPQREEAERQLHECRRKLFELEESQHPH